MSDVKQIDRIFKARDDVGVPSLKNVIINSTIVDSETQEIIGYGVVKCYAEAVLILDPNIRKRVKCSAVATGVNFAIEMCKRKGIEQLFIFSNTDPYTKVLKNKFGFKQASGVTLFLELGSDEEKKH